MGSTDPLAEFRPEFSRVIDVISSQRRDDLTTVQQTFEETARSATNPLVGRQHAQVAELMKVFIRTYFDNDLAQPSTAKQSKRSASTLTAQSTPSSKRRKVRKGTQSCWECKRRKIKCTFATPGARVCDGCRGRGTNCVSQEVEEDSAATLQDNITNATQDHLAKQQERHSGIPTLDSVDIADDSPMAKLAKAVSEFWPSQTELEQLLAVYPYTSSLSHGMICLPYRKHFARKHETPWAMVQLSDVSTEPAIVPVARRMLLLVTLLQGLGHCPLERKTSKNVSFREIMTGLYKVVTKNVTTDDTLLSSVEGIECLMLESMYENNSGNLRRAWIVNRKAIALAQALGIHAKDCQKAASMVIDEMTWERVDPGFMWYRSLATDRYLSLVLGLPQACFDEADVAIFLDPQDWSHIDTMERTTVNIAGMILKRNAIMKNDVIETLRIDKLLIKSAGIMHTDFWGVDAEMRVVDNGHYEDDVLSKTLGRMAQIAHHHLAVQLHLPFVLGTTPGEFYSKLVVAQACRSILTLYNTIRDDDQGSTYCRGIDFIALIASVALCMTHIEISRLDEDDGPINPSNALRHQRANDMGLVLKFSDILEGMKFRYNDTIATQTMAILGPLMDLEREAQRGAQFFMTIDGEEVVHSDNGYVSCTLKVCGGLEIIIPQFGRIRIERAIANRIGTVIHQGFEPVNWVYSRNQNSIGEPAGTAESLLSAEEWALHGADFALFDNLGANWVMPRD